MHSILFNLWLNQRKPNFSILISKQILVFFAIISKLKAWSEQKLSQMLNLNKKMIKSSFTNIVNFKLNIDCLYKLNKINGRLSVFKRHESKRERIKKQARRYFKTKSSSINTKAAIKIFKISPLIASRSGFRLDHAAIINS